MLVPDWDAPVLVSQLELPAISLPVALALHRLHTHVVLSTFQPQHVIGAGLEFYPSVPKRGARISV